jgi:hypothetical protein
VSIREGEKFAILAVENCATPLREAVELSDGTQVLSNVPAELSANWKKWLGEIRTEQLGDANLVFLRRRVSPTPQNFDHENKQLAYELTDIFWLLQLSGVLEYQKAFILTGASEKGSDVNYRDFNELLHFGRSGGPIKPLTVERLELALTHRGVWDDIRVNATEYRRLKRGLRLLARVLRESDGAERLHGFVRALEALVLPKTGKTRRQLIHRCKLLVSNAAVVEEFVGRAFDMRSDVEHVHEQDRSLDDVAADEREAYALHVMQQLERLTCGAYLNVLSNSSVREHFRTDESLAAFWSLDEAEQRTHWGHATAIV